MATFIVLGSWTAEGAKAYADAPARAKANAEAAAAMGGRIVATYWTLGKYDFVSIIEAPSDEAMTAGLLVAAARGFPAPSPCAPSRWMSSRASSPRRRPPAAEIRSAASAARHLELAGCLQPHALRRGRTFVLVRGEDHDRDRLPVERLGDKGPERDDRVSCAEQDGGRSDSGSDELGQHARAGARAPAGRHDNTRPATFAPCCG